MSTSRLFLALLAVLALNSPALSGPHENGTLILHVRPGTVSTSGACGQSGLEACPSAATRFDGPGGWVAHVFAAFPESSSPRLIGITFGVEYDAQVSIESFGMCGDFELPNTGWPASGQGNTVTWNAPQFGHLIEVYWFAGDDSYGSAARLEMTPHPDGGGYFGDDSVPAILDPIADYGVLGFNTDGYLPCPYPQQSICTLELLPSKINVYQPCGGAFPVTLQVNHVEQLAGFEVCAGYSETFLDLESVAIDATFLGGTGRPVYPVSPIPCAPSCQSSGIRFGAFTNGSHSAPSGSGVLAQLYFRPQAAGAGSDSLCLEEEELFDPEIPPWPIEVVETRGAAITYRPHCYGDFNGDGNVTSLDLIQVISRWGCRVGSGCYDELRDLNLLARGNYCASTPDGGIDVVDAQTVAGRWHQGCPGPTPAFGPADSTAAVRISPAQSFIHAFVGDTTSVALVVDGAVNLGAFEAEILFDPAVLQVEEIQTGSLLAGTGRTVFALGPAIDNQAGRAQFGKCTVGEAPGVNGSGVLVRIVFRIEVCDRTTNLEIGNVILTSVDGWPQVVGETSGGSMQIGCLSSVPGAEERRNGPALFPNRPNPLTSSTQIEFSIPVSRTADHRVRLAIFDATGRLIRSLCDRDLGSGRHRVEWDGRDGEGRETPGGTYFCRLACDGTVLTRQISLLR